MILSDTFGWLETRGSSEIQGEVEEFDYYPD